MVKAGIITHYYKSTNYGGNLQAYALAEYLRKNGVDAEQICFERVPSSGIKSRAIMALSALKKAKLALLHPKVSLNIRKRNKRISDFNRNAIAHSRRVYTKANIHEAADEYDVFITGSDQVWHPSAVCDEYLLDFVPKEKKKISYAASVATDSLSADVQSRYKKSFADYDAISVREKNATELIAPLYDGCVEHCADPVFLLSGEEWESVLPENKYKEKYVFCYFLGNNPENRKLSSEYAKKLGYTLISMPHLLGRFIPSDEADYEICEYDASPADFISLIKNAEAVFTDSFHASAFSVIYRKNFFVLPRSKGENAMSSRIYSLLGSVGAEERFCDTREKQTLSYVLENEKNGYYSEDAELDALICRSKEYLKINVRGSNDEQ